MAKFKKGDSVGYMKRGLGGVSGPHTYIRTDEFGQAWFSTNTWIEESRLFAWPCKGSVVNTPCDPSWDYAEAQRLRDTAKAAVKAYNEYVSRKPETVFLKMPDY